MSEDPLPEPIFSALLDVLIPARSASLPGAGSLGLAAYVEPRLGVGVSGVSIGLLDPVRGRTGLFREA